MEKYIVRIPKIGTWIDSNAFGGFYVDKEYQNRRIQRAKDSWKNTINEPLRVCNRIVEIENYQERGCLPCEMEYYTEPNPYYGWKEEQLEIIIEK